MTCVKMVRVCFVLVLTVLFLVGCSEYSRFGGEFYAGETITPGQIAEISAGIAAAKESLASTSKANAAKTEKSLSPETDQAGNIIVYWTAGGGVYHVDRSCSSLSNSTSILSGSIKKAEAAGKERACKRCGGEYVEQTADGNEAGGEGSN